VNHGEDECALRNRDTSLNFWITLFLEKSENIKIRKFLLFSTLFLNLAILAFFKYYNFFIESFSAFLHLLGFTVHFTSLQWLLPVGISFYTFQSISYTFDVYHKKSPAETSWIYFSLYLCYFPQLVAGPIERSQDLLPQLHRLSPATPLQFQQGLWLILWGYFLKIVIADNIARNTNYVFTPHFYTESFSALSVLLGMLSFSLQIYTDFAGYSCIARGVSKGLGIELMQNFCHPYFSKNPSEFWQRWHISLSLWLRDYLYIPLGGNRISPRTTYRNLCIVMILGGLWHGSSGLFLLWGAYQGMGLCIHRFCKPYLPSSTNPFLVFISRTLLFIFILYGWLIFRCTSFDQLQHFTLILCTHWWLPFPFQHFFISLFWLFIGFLIVGIVDMIQHFSQNEYLLSFTGNWKDWTFTFITVLSLILFGSESKTFIYFQF
jgi:alginate O-acetyltransferase complex protein AlgI